MSIVSPKLSKKLLPIVLILFILEVFSFPFVVGITYANRAKAPDHILRYGVNKLTWDTPERINEEGVYELSLFSDDYNGEAKSADGEKIVAPGTSGENVVRLVNGVKGAIDYYAILYHKKTTADLNVRTTLSGDNLIDSAFSHTLPNGVEPQHIIRSVKGTLLGGGAQDFDINWVWDFYTSDAQDVVDTALGDKGVLDEVEVGFYLIVEDYNNYDHPGGIGSGDGTGGTLVTASPIPYSPSPTPVPSESPVVSLAPTSTPVPTATPSDDINQDTDGDGKPDINIDTDGDSDPDINIDTDGDREPEINIDTNGNLRPDVNIDLNGDLKPDINNDVDFDLIPDKDKVILDGDNAFITDEAADSIIDMKPDDDPNVKIPFYNLDRDVSSVEMSDEAMGFIGENGNGIHIIVTGFEVVLDNEAVKAIVEQATGDTIKITVMEIPENLLSKPQKNAIANQNVVKTYTAIVTSNGVKITDFYNGTATVYIPFVIPEGKTPGDYTFVMLNDNGSMTVINAVYENGRFVFTTNKFGEFVLLGGKAEDVIKPGTVVTPTAPKTGDNEYIGMYIALMLISFGVLVLLFIDRKINKED